MAITKSAKKAHRASLRKRVFNVRRMDAVRDVVKKITRLLKEGKKADAAKLLPAAYKAIDKAAKGHTIPRGRADRKKSRLVSFVNTSVHT